MIDLGQQFGSYGEHVLPSLVQNQDAIVIGSGHGFAGAMGSGLTAAGLILQDEQ